MMLQTSARPGAAPHAVVRVDVSFPVIPGRGGPVI
jgi:hypothetical protein